MATINPNIIGINDSGFHQENPVLSNIGLFGFLDNTQTSLSFNDSTFVFTLTDTGSGWQYYRNGKLITISGNKTVTITGTPPTKNVYFIYIDSDDGALIQSTTSWTLDDTIVPVALLTFDNTLTPKYFISDERHNSDVARAIHHYLHTVVKTRLTGGCTLSNYTVKPSSPADSHNQIYIAETYINDDGLSHTLSALSSADYSVFYKSSTAWNWLTGLTVPFKYGTYIQYNNSGTMTDAGGNKFVNYYLIATNMSGDGRFIWIAGETEYSTLASALAENPLYFSFTNLPILEFVICYQLTFSTSAGYSTTGKCRIESEPKFLNFSSSSIAIPATTENGASVTLDTSNFDNNLSASDDTVQKAMETIDEMTAGSGGHVIQDDGTPMTARSNLNFTGAGVTVTDDSGNDATIVTIAGGGSSTEPISTKTADYTITTSDKNIIADCSSGAIILTLPSVASASGYRFYIKKIDDTNNQLTVAGDGSELIDGINRIIISYENTAIELISDGTNWHIN